MAYNKCVIISTSESLHLKVKAVLTDKSRDEIFEFPFVYGQTVHSIPNVKKVQRPLLPNDYSYELLQGNDIEKLRYIEESNAKRYGVDYDIYIIQIYSLKHK